MGNKGQKRKKDKYYCEYHDFHMKKTEVYKNRCFEKDCKWLHNITNEVQKYWTVE